MPSELFCTCKAINRGSLWGESPRAASFVLPGEQPCDCGILSKEGIWGDLNHDGLSADAGYAGGAFIV